MTTAQTLDAYLERFNGLDDKAQSELRQIIDAATGNKFGIPNPGPQTEAYISSADELFYGGAAGGGKSYLGCSLAVNEHKNSLILRRIGKNLKGITREIQGIIGTRDGYNSQENVWRLPNGNIIDLGHCEHEHSRENYQGVPHDLIVFDEITQFLESQYTYIIGWNRSADKSQRCRVLVTGNPPTTAEGLWVVQRWGAWLDPQHPNPAKPGELRWYTTISGEDTEVDADYIGPKGERPRSRTFIPALLSDNPDLAETGYAATIEAMPEPLRTMMLEGRFDVSRPDDEWQLLPSDWIREAQNRWTERPPERAEMTSMGVDVAQGGVDKTVLAPLWINWFDELKVKPGAETPAPGDVVAFISQHRRHNAQVNVDMGGGYGGGVLERLNEQFVPAFGVVPGGGGRGGPRDMQGYQFKNVRAEMYWRFREGLNPELREDIALPINQELFSELASIRYIIRGQIIQIESKEEIKKRIGRSTDLADAVVMAWFGSKHKPVYAQNAERRKPTVNLGHSKYKSKRRK